MAKVLECNAKKVPPDYVVVPLKECVCKLYEIQDDSDTNELVVRYMDSVQHTAQIRSTSHKITLRPRQNVELGCESCLESGRYEKSIKGHQQLLLLDVVCPSWWYADITLDSVVFDTP